MDFAEIPRVYPTLTCNYHCPYCVNDPPKRQIISGDRWIDILNGWPGDTVIFTGGEPTLHPDFADIINGLQKAEIRVYTNMSWKKSWLDRLQRKINVYASFHPNQKNSAEEVAEKTRYLLDQGHGLINIHINKASGEHDKHLETFSKYGIKLVMEEDQYQSPKYTERLGTTDVLCTMPRSLIGPDGLRYICVAKLEDGNPTGRIEHQQIPAVRPCHIYGQCRPCDAMVRTVQPL